jgi:acetyl esterase/lipase
VGGESDFNVPIGGSEQMYQALRTLGVPAQLVIYPGQFHLLTRPSYIHDRMQRYLAWFDKYLGEEKATGARERERSDLQHPQHVFEFRDHLLDQ